MFQMVVTWLRRLVADFSPRRPGFHLWTVHVRFELDTLALGSVSLYVIRLYPDSIILPAFHNHLSFNTSLIRRTSGRKLGNFKQSNALSCMAAKYLNPEMTLCFEIQLLPKMEEFYIYSTLKSIYDLMVPRDR